MIFRIDYKETVSEKICAMYENGKCVYRPIFYRTVFYSAPNINDAEVLFRNDHLHEDIEIRRTCGLDEQNYGRVFGPVEDK